MKSIRWIMAVLAITMFLGVPILSHSADEQKAEPAAATDAAPKAEAPKEEAKQDTAAPVKTDAPKAEAAAETPAK